MDAESISGVVKSLVIESSNLKTFSLTYGLTRYSIYVRIISF